MKVLRPTPLLLSCLLALTPVLAKPATPSTAPNSAKSNATAYGASKRTSRFEQAVEQLQNYHPDQAIISFSRALLASKSASKNFKATVFLMIGRAFQADENDLAAVQAMTIAHELAPNDQTITAYLADGLVRSGQRDKAAKYFNWLREQKEKSLATLEILALEAVRTSESEKAKEYLTTALKMPGGKKDTHLLLLYARLLAKMGLSTQSGAMFKQAADASSNAYLKNMAEATVQRLAGNTKKQIEFLKAAGEILPNEPNWHVELGECYTNEGNNSAALDQFNLAMSGRHSSRAFLRTAIFTRGEKRYQDALNAASYVSKLKPWAFEPFQSKGATYLIMKDYKNAEIELVKANSADKYVESVYTDLARCFIEQSQFDKARETYKRALVNCPGSLLVLKRLGNLEAKQGNEAAARQCYEKIVTLVPNSVDVNVLVKSELATAHAKLGSYFYKDQKFDQALESAKMFNKLKFVPPLPPLLTLIHLRPGHLEHPTTAAEKEYDNHIMLADMLREGGRLDDCIAEYHKAEALNSDDIDLHSYLLNVLDEKGDLLESAKEDVILSSKLVNRVPAEIKKFTDQKPAQTKNETQTPTDAQSSVVPQ
ncbi:hypothetical protein BH10CYA1_BH10CYA1_37820 [soil metagenome]